MIRALCWLWMGCLTACGSMPAPEPVGLEHAQVPEAEVIARVPAADCQALLKRTVDVLRARGFYIDRHDTRFGVVTTWPKKVPTAGEFWREGGLGLEGSMQHLRRRVSVRLLPIEDDATGEARMLCVTAWILHQQRPALHLTRSIRGPATSMDRPAEQKGRMVGGHVREIPWRLDRAYARALGEMLVASE